jgi:prepilin-type processing-associated H-X9-DG protein
MEQENEQVKSESSKLVRTLLKLSIAIAIIAFLIFLALPKMHKDTELPRIVICRSNLRQISLSVLIYSQDNDGSLPTSEKWNDMIVEYMGNEKSYRCPLVEKQAKKTSTYFLNRNLRNLKEPNLADVVLLFEGQPRWNQTGGAEDMVYRHGKEKDPICNVAFADGHVERVKKSEAGKLKWEVVSAD